MQEQVTLPYGDRQSLSLELETDRLIAHCGQPQGEPLDDVVAAVSAALSHPIDFPSVAEAVVPSDRVAIAIDAELPQVDTIVAGIVQSLAEAGIDPLNISLVFPDTYQTSQIMGDRFPARFREKVACVKHDANNANGLSYLAASHDAQPIYVNRVIFDADMVIPVGCLRVAGAHGYHGIRGGVFPTFADTATRNRFLLPADSTAAARERRQQEMEEAAWLLGARLTLQVVPAHGSGVLHVVSGDIDSVDRTCRELAERAWHSRIRQRADLVVAAVDGGQEQQTWDNLARALTAAMRVVEDEGGSIAICTQLDQRPGPAMQRIIGADSWEDARRELLAVSAPDVHAAIQLADAVRRVRVYLLSELNESLVEDLGVAYVAGQREIENLCRRHDSCILISNAQHAWPTLQDLTVPS